MPAEPTDRADSLAAALAAVSERMAVLVREEIELAKAEMVQKASSLARGAAAVVAGAVFGVFALIFVLLSIAWGINSLAGSVWLGFVVVMVVLVIATVGAFLFAWRKLRVGAPVPRMAIDEARRIGGTIRPGTER
ncbi:MAG TPA: phage holin family protein [Solirubrobacteraceae bacterium]|nr:phage holin family protein [Solirubrobacteraceae bacterium]